MEKDICDLIDSINELSIEHTTTTENSVLKKGGQYFTLSPSLLSSLFERTSHLSTRRKIDILEPSYGTGRVILECVKQFGKRCNITGIEINKELFEKTNVKLKSADCKINLIQDDFLQHDFKRDKYDLIVGNPPYFEMKLSKEQREEYKEIISGRVNIYSLFLYKCIQLLKTNGHLHFVLPKSILSSKYFNLLRHYIYKTCDIIDIITFDNDSMFRKAKQNVIVLLLRKHEIELEMIDFSNLDNKHVVVVNNRLIFTKESALIDKLLQNSTTICNLNCTVKTGPTEWNKWKEDLTDETEGTLQLIYANNLNNDDLEPTSRNKGRSRLKITEKTKSSIQRGPFILINRIISPQNPILKIYFEKSRERQYFVENHVNIISGSLEDLEIIYKSLQNPKTTEFIKAFCSNTQLSQDELETIIPIFR